MQETQVQSVSWKDPLEKEMATHFSILGWKNPMDRGAWQAIVRGLPRVDTTEYHQASAFPYYLFFFFSHLPPLTYSVLCLLYLFIVCVLHWNASSMKAGIFI